MILMIYRRRKTGSFVTSLLCGLLLTLAETGETLAQPARDAEWARVIEDDRSIKIDTDKLEAVIPKNSPKQWMTGIEKGSFLDKTTGFREIGDGLMVIDWLRERVLHALSPRPEVWLPPRHAQNSGAFHSRLPSAG